MTTDTQNLSGSCHCGKVQLQLPGAPDTGLVCNCSICRRLGALWVYYGYGEVKITGYPEHTESYVWGDKTLETVRCRHCGCVTHWYPLQPQAGQRHGVNLRNFDLALQVSLKIRHFDGAETWTYLD